MLLGLLPALIQVDWLLADGNRDYTILDLTIGEVNGLNDLNQYRMIVVAKPNDSLSRNMLIGFLDIFVVVAIT